jgi:hypothetical protein
MGDILSTYSGRLEELRNPTFLSDRRYPGQVLNPEPPEYEPGVLTTWSSDACCRETNIYIQNCNVPFFIFLGFKRGKSCIAGRTYS